MRNEGLRRQFYHILWSSGQQLEEALGHLRGTALQDREVGYPGSDSCWEAEDTGQEPGEKTGGDTEQYGGSWRRAGGTHSVTGGTHDVTIQHCAAQANLQCRPMVDMFALGYPRGNTAPPTFLFAGPHGRL